MLLYISEGSTPKQSTEQSTQTMDESVSTLHGGVVIGNFSHCEHNNSVVIGNNQKSDKPNQLKIGNNDISASRDITDEEFQEILATFKSVRDALPK